MATITADPIDLDEAVFAAGDLDWQDQALCNQTDPELFFPEKGGCTKQAKQVCKICPVRAECLDYALANRVRFGIWGGLSDRERRRLAAKAAAQDATHHPQPADLPAPAAQRHGTEAAA